MAVTQADRWLYGQLRTIGTWRDDPVGEAVAESLAHALAGVDALAAAGTLSAATATEWRVVFERAAAGDDRTVAGPELRDRATRVLGELLEAPDTEEFQAALHLIAAIGATDGGEWNAKLRERHGWASIEEERAAERALNEGATEVDLIEVLSGPGEVCRGYRLLLVLRFGDGVSVLLDKHEGETPDLEWPEWELGDDRGTSYWAQGSSESDESEHVSFTPFVPAEAGWLQVRLQGHADIAFRVPLA